MTVRSLTLARPLRLERARWLPSALPAGAALVFAAFVALQYRLLQPGLLYPDGYQYLLMARGIGQHLNAAAQLGPHGDVLAPSGDAAVKPLFPALVALLGTIGVSPLAAARVVTATASALVPPLCGLVALRLGAARWAAVAAGALCLTSPALRYWTGFPGPDALAQAFALGAVFVLLHRRPGLGGALAALCVLTRPEYALPAAAALAAALAARRTRPEAGRAVTAGLVTGAVVLALVRPSLLNGVSPRSVLGAAIAVAAAAGVLLVAGRLRKGVMPLAGAGLFAASAALAGGGWARFAHDDWGLLGLAAVGLVLALCRRQTRATALRLSALALLPAAAYWLKNPGSERYVTQLVPALALAAALGAPAAAHVRRLVPVLAAVALAAAALQTRAEAGPDAFRALAPLLPRDARPLVTAAPDAYGVLLRDRSVRVLRPGARGVVLLDGAARAYEPDLTVRGRLLAKIRVARPFLRPDGRVDAAPALLYRGVVVPRIPR